MWTATLERPHGESRELRGGWWVTVWCGRSPPSPCWAAPSDPSLSMSSKGLSPTNHNINVTTQTPSCPQTALQSKHTACYVKDGNQHVSHRHPATGLVSHPETDEIRSGVSNPTCQTLTLQVTIRASYVETPQGNTVVRQHLQQCYHHSLLFTVPFLMTVFSLLVHTVRRCGISKFNLRAKHSFTGQVLEWQSDVLQQHVLDESSSDRLHRDPLTAHDCPPPPVPYPQPYQLHHPPNPPPPSISCPQVNGSPVATLLLSHHTPPWGTWGRSICVTLLRWSPGNVPKDNQCTHQLRPTRLTPARSAPAFGG